ncbi:MAG: TIM barrel protein [Verrucomicrobia bacterium]|jgi:sugar phosphate isomerase/epimerase|nr:TIM barrel protein [Verrucomicrobiota bacterium]
MLRTGALSITFRKFSCEAFIDIVCKADLQAIEWGGDVHVPPGDLAKASRIGSLTRQAGLEVAAYGSYYRTESLAAAESDFPAILDTARELGAPLIRVWAGTLGSADLTDEGRAELVRHSRLLADMAAHKGLIVASEYHNGTVTDTPESAARFLEEVDHPNYQTLWQPHNGAPYETALASLKQVLPRLANLHVFHWWPDAAHRLPLADGRERWQGYFEVAAASGRDHDCLLEFVRNDDPAQFLEDARTLRELLA